MCGSVETLRAFVVLREDRADDDVALRRIWTGGRVGPLSPSFSAFFRNERILRQGTLVGIAGQAMWIHVDPGGDSVSMSFWQKSLYPCVWCPGEHQS